MLIVGKLGHIWDDFDAFYRFMVLNMPLSLTMKVTRVKSHQVAKLPMSQLC